VGEFYPVLIVQADGIDRDEAAAERRDEANYHRCLQLRRLITTESRPLVAVQAMQIISSISNVTM